MSYEQAKPQRRSRGPIVLLAVFAVLAFCFGWYWFQIDRWDDHVTVCGSSLELSDGYRAIAADEQFGEIPAGSSVTRIVPPEDVELPERLSDVLVSIGPFERAIEESTEWGIELADALASVERDGQRQSVVGDRINSGGCQASILFLVGGVESEFYERPWVMGLSE